MSDADNNKRYAHITLSIEECDERGAVKDGISIYLNKRLEIDLLLPENIIVARQHQICEAVGEERGSRDSGQFVGIAHPCSSPPGMIIATAILDYIKRRLGL